jgi:hypothetical protein
MVVFEGKAFNETRVVYMEVRDNYNSRKVYYDSTLSVFLTPDSLPCHTGHLDFDYKSHQQAITKMNELVKIIQAREEELLKLCHTN